MYRFMDVPVRSAAGRVGTHALAAGESLPFGRAPTGLIGLPDGSGVVLANRAMTRPREARAR